MKKNLYYHVMFQRQNVLLEMFLGFFFSICSWPRLVLEVFLRRNMGERYFSFAGVLIITFFFCGLTLIGMVLLVFMFPSNKLTSEAISKSIGHLLFGALFLYAGIQRRKEIKRLPSVFDFARFSMSTGTPLMEYYDKYPFLTWLTENPRRIATVLEPGIFLLLGLLLLLLKQYVGIIIILCSIIYSLSYVAAYRLGDHLVMDRIDSIIVSEEFAKSFEQDKDSSETRGFNAYGRRPADPALRRRVTESFLAEDDKDIAVAL